jgi:AraC-like DNA-binding protein
MSDAPVLPIAVVMVRSLALGVSRLGLDGNRVLAAAAAHPCEPAGCCSAVAVGMVIGELARENGIEQMGLELAQNISLGWFGTLDYQFSTSATLGDALAAIGPELNSLGPVINMEIAIEGDMAHIRSRQTPGMPAGEPMVAMMRDFNLAVMVRRMRDVLGEDAVPVKAVRFFHDAPPSSAAHERFFRAPVEFGTKTGFDELVVPVALFGAPLLTADPILAQALRDRGRGGRAETPPDPFLERIRAVIQAALPEGDTALGVDVLAAQLDISARALQRRLKDRKLSVSGLIDEQRRAVAETLLSRESVLLCDVAYHLGFRDVKAFFRAFRRWTGTSPRAFQKSKATAE